MKIAVNQFDGGVAEDVRAAAPNQYALAKHFDVSQPHRLVPFHDMVAEGGSIAAYGIQSIEVMAASGGSAYIYALGNTSGGSYPQILEKPSTSLITDSFSPSTNGAGAAGNVLSTTLRAYRNQFKLYFMKTNAPTTIIDSYEPSTDTYTSTVGTINDFGSNNRFPRPFVHPMDDIMYFGAGSTVAKLDGSTFTASAITIPNTYDIVDFCDYGPYLAILAAPTDGGSQPSRIFLWGRDTSLVEMDENISLGAGNAQILENIQGRLIAISGPSGNSTADLIPTITFREYAGGAPRVVFELRGTFNGPSNTYNISNLKARRGDDLLFPLWIDTDNSTVVQQIWRCGYNREGQFFVTPDILVNNDTALNSGDINGLDSFSDIVWVAFNLNGSLNRTNDSSSYTATSVYESAIFRSGMTETVKGASVHFEPLPSGATVTLKYKRDSESSWTTVKSYSTANGLRLDAVATEFTGKDAKEWRLRVESTGGAVITGIEFESVPKPDKPYASK